MTKKRASAQVGVRELKNSLSSYLARVKNGEVVTVTEHNSAIAEIRPAGASLGDASPVLAAWIKAGIVSAPIRPKRPLPKSFLSLPDGTATALLDEDRGE